VLPDEQTLLAKGILFRFGALSLQAGIYPDNPDPADGQDAIADNVIWEIPVKSTLGDDV
jgi:hypothetical protein